MQYLVSSSSEKSMTWLKSNIVKFCYSDKNVVGLCLQRYNEDYEPVG